MDAMRTDFARGRVAARHIGAPGTLIPDPYLPVIADIAHRPYHKSHLLDPGGSG